MSNVDAAKALIMKYESLRLEAYLDGGGVATIGWGSTRMADGSRVRLGQKINQELADALFDEHFWDCKERVEDLCLPIVLNENQLGAVVSLVYNIGINAFRTSTLLKYIHERWSEVDSIAPQFLRWDHDNGIVVDGLTKRRKEEMELFLT